MSTEHKPAPTTPHLPTPRAGTTQPRAPSPQPPRPRAASKAAAPATKLPDDFIAIRSTQEGSDEEPRLTVMPRGALLQRTYSTALDYLGPQINNATFTTRDMPGFEGTPVNIAPQHWVELLPHTKVMEAKLPPQRPVKRVEKSSVPTLKQKKSLWTKTKPSRFAAPTFWALFVLIVVVFCIYEYLW